jgi:hypothetical protein
MMCQTHSTQSGDNKQKHGQSEHNYFHKIVEEVISLEPNCGDNVTSFLSSKPVCELAEPAAIGAVGSSDRERKVP